MRISLAKKFNLLTIAIILATSVLLSVFYLVDETKDNHQELLNDGRAAAAMAALNSEYGIYTGDKKSLGQVVESLYMVNGIAYVAIYDLRGKSLMEKNFVPGISMKWNAESAPAQEEKIVAAEHMDAESGVPYFDIVAPVVSYAQHDVMDPFSFKSGRGEARVIGYVRLGLTQESLRKRTRDLLLSMSLFTFVCIAAGIVLTVIMTRRISSPLNRLNEATRAVSEGRLDRPVEITTRDEVADLARAFNTMMGRLAEYRGEVETRTNELTSTNEQLRQEIQARKTAEDQLLHDAFHDGLTGLPNRALFMDRLTHAIAIARRRKEYLFAVLFLDLDRFKVVNDSLGHLVGDRLLVALGMRLSECLRPGDTVARLGGDEFAILLEDISGMGNAIMIAERIARELLSPFAIEGHEVFTSGSIGIALSAQTYDKAEQILRDADTAMYQAKTQGRARYIVFEPGMHAQAVERLRLETDLRRAAERHEFVVYYQPILSLKARSVIGCEALVRWHHPERGIVMPGGFIQAAEETGLIVTIDRIVLREACFQMRDWLSQLPAGADRFVSVNLSNKQLAQPDLVGHVEGVLRETGLLPKNLKLEITENAIIENPEATAAMLAQLKALGVRLYIDDFGTGYSSLSYLHRLPVDGLKIDRSFINRLGQSGENQEIIRTIMTLAQDLGLDVIAEGVETDYQLSQIDDLKCENWQGFLFSKAVPRDEAAAMFLEQHTFPR